MSKRLIIVAITIAAASIAYSQKKAEPFEKTSPHARKIIPVMTEWLSLSNKHDVAALDKLLPADLVLTFQDGEVLTKDQYIASLKANPADFTIKDFDQKVDLFGNAAVIRARYEVAVGTNIKLDFRYTVTFIKRKGRWQPIAFHSSPLVKK